MTDGAYGAGALRPGTRLGTYVLLDRLAVGGMAELYLARQKGIEKFERLVVVKRVLPHLAENPEFVGMFLNEARIAATLDHPNIAQVTDIGKEAGEHFFAMEYVHGRDLLQVLKRGDQEPMPMSCALLITIGVAAGLHHAHEAVSLDGTVLGVVHRDVSPSNIIISFDGTPKIVDFGIAKASERTSTTMAGTMKGKVGYMSPEQCRGERIDRRSDIFALGILLYEVTTGVRAFYAANNYATMAKIARGEVQPPSTHVPDYPEQLEAIVMRALSLERDDRYPTAQAMQVDLEQFVHEQHLRLSAVDLGKYMERLFGHQTYPSMTLPVVEDPTMAAVPVVAPRRGIGRFAGVLAALAVGAGLGAAAISAGSSSPPPETPPAPVAAPAPAPAVAPPVPTPIAAPTPAAPLEEPAAQAEPAPPPKATTPKKNPRKRKKKRAKAEKSPPPEKKSSIKDVLYPPGQEPP